MNLDTIQNAPAPEASHTMPAHVCAFCQSVCDADFNRVAKLLPVDYETYSQQQDINQNAGTSATGHGMCRQCKAELLAADK